MKKLSLILAFLVGSITTAFAACAPPAVMHDFPGTAFNMDMATSSTGNCAGKIDADTSSQLHADLTAALPVTKNGSPVGVTGLTPGTAQTGTIVAINHDLTSIGGTAAIPDPCQTAAKAYTPINVVTATNTIITGVSAKKKYVCGIFLYPAGTDNVAIFQATTGTACATALVGVIGGTTTATGMVMTAQAGFVLGTGASAIAATTVVNTDLCIVTSAAVQLSGVVVTVDQ